MSKESIELARRYVETFNAGGLDAVVQLWHPGIEIYDPTSFPDARRYEGPEAARGIVESYLGLGWDGQFREPEYVDAGDEALVVWKARLAIPRGGGDQIENLIAHLYLFENGRVRRIRQYTSREEAFEAAGLST